MEPKYLLHPRTQLLVIGQGLLQGNRNSQASLLSLLPGEAVAGLQELVDREMVKGWSAIQLQKKVTEDQGCEGNPIHLLQTSDCGLQTPMIQKLWELEESHPE